MKLKYIKGLLGNKKYDPTKFSSEPLYPDDCEIKSIKGYNQAREEDEKREIELDVERLEQYIDDWIVEWATAKQEIDNPVGLSTYLAEKLKESFRDIIKVKEK